MRYILHAVFCSDDWFYSGLIRKWHLCDYSMCAGICASIATLLWNIFGASCPILIKSDRQEDIKLLSSYKWLNRGKRCYLSTVSNPDWGKGLSMSSPFNRHHSITAERLWDKNPSGIISFNAHRLTWFSPPPCLPKYVKIDCGLFSALFK